MPSTKDKSICYGCRCETCRWRAAGSNCYYNEYGADASRCSQCVDGVKRVDLAEWKVKSFSCRGYERQERHDFGEKEGAKP